jgi:muramoyltetrapeptide carboxypeptidase
MIKANPKRICSYSDGTFLLNPIWAQTGLVTYYGQAPHLFLDMSDYDAKHFWEHLVFDSMTEHVANSQLKVQTTGVGEGILIGGYARNFALNISSSYLPLDPEEKYVLFIEDHDSFGGVDYVSAMLTAVE